MFENNYSHNVQQLLSGHILKKKQHFLWENMVKALLAYLWYQRNQRTFHDKEMRWIDRFESATRNASAWCSLNKDFEAYSIQEISLSF